MSISLPKPAFLSCDETSLKLKWEVIDHSLLTSLALQYKEVFETWEQAKDCPIPVNSPDGAQLSSADVVDLKPGTPYYVRLVAVTKDGTSVQGPETVFDTQPIDCTPKTRKCTIS
jgi:hypothetical protein